MATGYGLDDPGFESRWGARFSAPVPTGPGAHPASSTVGTGSFPGVKSGRGVTLTLHPLLLLWSRKGRAMLLLPLCVVRPVESRSACTVQLYIYSPQCLYSTAIPLLPSVPVQYSYTSTPLNACTVQLYLYSPQFLYNGALYLAVLIKCYSAFAKYRKATISFVISVSPSALNNSVPTGRDFQEIGVRLFFSKICPEYSSLIKIWQEYLCTFVITSRWILLRIRNVSDKICRKNKKYIYFMFKNFFSPENPTVNKMMWKNMIQTGHRQQYNRAHAFCTPNNWIYKHTLRICNTYCFSTATMVTRTCLISIFYAQCPSFLFIILMFVS